MYQSHRWREKSPKEACAVNWTRTCVKVATLSVDSAIQPHFISLCKTINNMNNLNELIETFRNIETIY
jgi:hypothetical protein